MLELLESLSAPTYNEIVDSLNVDDRWLSLAVSLRSFRIRIEFKDVELQKWRKSESPSTVLLQELKTRCCPLVVFREMLLEANLLETLAIIADPEPLNIDEQPDGQADCRRHQESGEKCQHVHRDSELVLKCRASGMPPPKYQWHRFNTPLEGYTESILRIANFSFEDEGEYWCRASHYSRDGKEESRQSDYVVCKVIHELPRLSKPFCVTDQTLEQGRPFCVTDSIVEPDKAFCIKVEVKCDSPYTIQWHKDNVVLNGKNSQALLIAKPTFEDSGKYFCSASNEAGDVNSSAIEVRVEYPHARPTRKVALLIGNSIYDNYDVLTTPSNDILLFADHLRKVDFEVISLVNLSLGEMQKAIDGFFKLLVPGSYAVFCFIGHGFHYNKRDYMMPVDCNVADDEHLLDSASVICDDILEQKAIQSGLGLFVMIADMCRRKQRCSFKADENLEDPDDCEAGSTSQTHIIRLYSTSENQSAYEVNGRKNGVYIPKLCEHIFQDKPIYDAVGDANRSFRNHPVAKKQIPAMKAQGINSMKLTDAAVNKVPIILKSYPILNLPFPLCISPHRGQICNALDVTFLRPQQPLDIKFELPEDLICCELPTEPGIRGITIYNIQKTKGAFPVNVCLSDGTTTEPRRLCVQLHGTLVGPASGLIL